jgi:hypothetical protein
MDSLILVLGGQSSHYLQRREYGAMRQIAEALLDLGKKRHDATSYVIGHRAMGIWCGAACGAARR